MFGKMKNISYNPCLFYVLLILSFSLSVTNVADENKTNKALPICTLIVNSLMIMLMIMLMMLKELKIDIPPILQQDFKYPMFIMVLILSFILSISNISDDDQENKSLSIIVLIIDSVVLLLSGYALMNNFKK